MDRVIKEGKVAIAITPDYGGGWSTNCSETWEQEALMFSPLMIQMVLDGKRMDLTDEWVKANLSISDFCAASRHKLEIAWVPTGQKIYLYQYDGYECIALEEDMIEV